MNERIRELHNQARDFYLQDEYMDLSMKDLHRLVQEKFAQLIIREYEKLLPEICPWVGADKEGPMYGWHVQFVARKHFGVSE